MGVARNWNSKVANVSNVQSRYTNSWPSHMIAYMSKPVCSSTSGHLRQNYFEQLCWWSIVYWWNSDMGAPLRTFQKIKRGHGPSNVANGIVNIHKAFIYLYDSLIRLKVSDEHLAVTHGCPSSDITIVIPCVLPITVLVSLTSTLSSICLRLLQAAHFGH